MLDRLLFRFTGMRTALAVTFVSVLLRVACVVGQAFSLAFERGNPKCA